MPENPVDSIVSNIALALAASSDAAWISLRPPAAMLRRAFGPAADAADATLIERCVRELPPAGRPSSQSGALGALAEQALLACEEDPAFEQQLAVAASALHNLAALCLLASAEPVTNFELSLASAAIFDYIDRAISSDSAGARVTLIGQLRPGDADRQIDPDSAIRMFPKLYIRYSAGEPWPLLSLHQYSFSRRKRAQPWFTDEPQSANEADDLELRTDIFIRTRLMPLPAALPIQRGHVRVEPQAATALVRTEITSRSTAIATYIRVADRSLFPSP